jgi:hypothetical protein
MNANSHFVRVGLHQERRVGRDDSTCPVRFVRPLPVDLASGEAWRSHLPAHEDCPLGSEPFPDLSALARLERWGLRLEGALVVWCLWCAVVLVWRCLGGAS